MTFKYLVALFVLGSTNGLSFTSGNADTDNLPLTQEAAAKNVFSVISGYKDEGAEKSTSKLVQNVIARTMVEEDCAKSTFGCCPDGAKIAVGANFEGCEAIKENCTVSYYGCCPDGVSLVLKPSLCSPSANSTSCEQECTSDADCIGNWKCCTRLCSSHQPAPEEPLATTTPVLIVTPPQYSGEPAYIQPPEDPVVRAEEGSYVTMKCNATGNPRPTLSWSKGAKQIDSTISRHRILRDGALQIVGLYRSDVGIYTCTANNNLAAPARVEYKLDVTEPHNRSSSIIGEENNDVTVALNSPAQLNCYAIGWPRPSVSWMHENEMIHLKNEAYEQRRDHSLLIRSVNLVDLGVYTCEAFNGIDKSSLWSVVLQAHGPVHDVSPEHQKYMNYIVDPPNERTNEPAPSDIGAIVPPPDNVTERYRGPLKVKVSVPRNRFPEGSEVSIACDVDGYPKPRILWYKDGNIIQTDNRVQISGQLTEANRLVISNARREDSGTYYCVAINQFTASSGSVLIEVSVPVKLNVSVPRKKFTEGSEVSITCDVNEFSITEIRWYKDEDVIQTDNRMQIPTKELIIPNAKRKDSGTYRCEAYDSLRDIIGSGAVTIEVLVPVKLNVSVPHNKFPEGSKVSITCNVDGFWIPAVRWYKDDNVIQSNERMLIIAYGLIISDAERNDSGTYRCEAYDSINDKIGSGTVTIKVLVPVKLNVAVPQNKFPEGNEVSITCNVDGFSNPRIRWYKDDNVIQPNQRMTINAYGLIILNALRKDSGTYRCEAYDSMSDKIGSGAVTIKVLVPVKLNVSVPQNKFPEGNEVSITCNVDGFSNPRIRWYKDDNVIQPNQRMTINAYELIILNAMRKESGTYRCEAYDSMSDKIGSGAVTIKVLVPVKLIVSVPQNKFPEGSKVSITCNVDGFWTPGIRWYKDDNVIQSNERMLVIAYGLIISDAERNDSGTYRCEAYNTMSDKVGSGAVTIEVLEPVKLNVLVPQNKLSEGSEVSITCNVDGFSTPRIRWYKDDSVIQPNQRMTINAYGLIILNATRKDSGTYRCEAYDSMSDKIGSGAGTISVLAAGTFGPGYHSSLAKPRGDYRYIAGIGAYKVHTTVVTWNEARHACEKEDGHLAIINSVAEANAIVAILKKSEPITGSNNSGCVFLGFHDLYKKGEFVTIHGQSIARAGYNRWETGEPNNMDGAEHCGSVFIRTGNFNDVNCQKLHGFICELPL